MNTRLHSVLLLALWIASSSLPSALAQEAVRREAAWTTDEALKELALRPRDPYIQFVALQLCTAAGDTREAVQLIQNATSRREFAGNRNRSVDLYSIFSGSLAIQESLQLDALTQRPEVVAGEQTIPLGNLQGPQVKSHPWRELLDGKQPQVSRLAECIPADHLMIRFQSVSKLLQMQDLGDDWSTYVISQVQQRAYSAGMIARVQQQLAINTNSLLRPAYDAAIAEIGLTSSDLFFREGTDITLVMRLNESQFIRAQLEGLLTSAAEEHADATTVEEEYQGVPFKHVTTPDRAVHVFSAYPTPDLHVRTNSRVALERMLSTILEKPYQGARIQRMSDSDEFRYIRTLMPLGAEEEDGFVYMSDPFIRNLIGPEKKLTQRGRLVCRSHLQVISYASLLYRTQNGQPPTSLAQLHASGCLGTAEQPLELMCPNGGHYQLEKDGLTGSCQHHGTLNALVPCCEIPVAKVSAAEELEYQQFVQAYSQYWRTFFDPIAMRLQHSAKKSRVETIVLPLINNSIYSSLASTLGGSAEDLDSLPIPARNIFSIGARIDKQRLLESAGIQPPAAQGQINEPITEPTPLQSDEATRSLMQIALAIQNFHSTYKHFPPLPLPAVGGNSRGSVANLKPSGLSWRVHILPFMDENELYSKFKLDEAWDSPHNRELIKRIPAIYASASPQLAQVGKTRYVLPCHKDTVYSNKSRGIRIGEITDGTSNTILAIITDDEQAVVWTKPDDLEIDMDQPKRGWSQGVEQMIPIAMVDGSVQQLPTVATDEQVKELLTRHGGEVRSVQLIPTNVRGNLESNRRDYRRFMPWIDELNTPEFLHYGIGNQLGIHVCDADPLVDFNVPRFLGMLGGSFNGRSSMIFSEQGAFALLAMSLNAPVYLSAPIQDVEIVDGFLDRLDKYLAVMARAQSQSLGGFFRIEQDFYEVVTGLEQPVRAYAFHFGPLTWRFYWARIGDGLYVASKPFILGELRAATEKAASPTAVSAPTESAGSHGLIRVRPGNWNLVKTHYQIGWAESERRACLSNLTPISDLARASTSTSDQAAALAEVESLGQAAFHANYRCPCGGHYELHGATGTVSCTVHGSLAAPQQPVGREASQLKQLTDSLSDVRLQLTFLEDGLHAVVTIERK